MEKTKTQIALEYINANPEATADDFAKATNLDKQFFHNVRYKAKLKKAKAKVAKKKPIPLGNVTGTKVSLSKDSAVIHRLHQQIAQLENINNSLRVVISYLEHQLGLKKSGASV